MPTGKTCGNCSSFIRIKTFNGDRNGLCVSLDAGCHSDSSYAKRCEDYSGIKYDRNRNKN